MIPNTTIFAFVITVVFTFILPISILIILGIKKKIKGLPLLFGASAFFFSQIILRIPILSIISEHEYYKNFSEYYIPFILIICLSAGLFEESARLGGALLLKKHRTFKDVISFGLGHAFCEVIILVGISHINNIVLCIIVNDSSGILSSSLSPEVVETVIEQLTSINPFHLYLGIIERFSTVIFHLFATILVFKGVINKKMSYYLLAILAHTTFNFIGVLIAYYIGIVVTEIVLIIMVLAAGFYIMKQRKTFDKMPDSRGEIA